MGVTPKPDQLTPLRSDPQLTLEYEAVESGWKVIFEEFHTKLHFFLANNL
jgi:hypothetical protein